MRITFAFGRSGARVPECIQIGSGLLVETDDGQLAFLGGGRGDLIQAKEWISLFLPHKVLRGWEPRSPGAPAAAPRRDPDWAPPARNSITPSDSTAPRPAGRRGLGSAPVQAAPESAPRPWDALGTPPPAVATAFIRLAPPAALPLNHSRQGPWNAD